MRHTVSSNRVLLTLALIVLCTGAVLWRLYIVSVAKHEWYARRALSQSEGASNVLVRGNIYLGAGSDEPVLVATNRSFRLVQVVPRSIPENRRNDVIECLTAHTGVARESVATAVSEDRSGSRTIARRLTDEQAQALAACNLPGVVIGAEMDRAYPTGQLASDVLGFLGYSEQGRSGQYGVESFYDAQLSGLVERAAVARWDIVRSVKRLIGSGEERLDATTDRPRDIVLSLDRNIQRYAQQVLSEVLGKYSAASGVLIVQEPMSGRILAMADSPSFDPNVYGASPIGSFMNGSLQPFEPGSSFKPFTMAMGLEDERITPTTVFDDTGDVVVDGYTIKNFNEKHFGRVTMTEILEKSINTGTMWVQERVGNEEFLNHAIDMGFGQRTGIDLPGESPGDLENLRTNRRINYMTASFGQGITVTPLQMITAYSAIANGGRLMRPYVVATIVEPDGSRIDTQSELLGTPFSAKTAGMLRSMLTSVVDRGFDKARITRYDVAGKTGTAQIASPDGGYLEKEYNHTFVGFAPASAPKFVIFIKMERPKGITFAADSLSPAFRDMALFLLNYFNVPPTR